MEFLFYCFIVIVLSVSNQAFVEFEMGFEFMNTACANLRTAAEIEKAFYFPDVDTL